MQATIVHESRGRMRLRLRQKNISIRQADLLETWLKGQPWTREAVVHERTCCVIVTYTGDREAVLSALGAFTWAGAESSVTLPGHSTRTLNREFQEKLVGKVAVKAATTLFARPAADRPDCLAHDPLSAQRSALPGTSSDQGGDAGCVVHRDLRLPQGLRYCRHCHVFVGDR